MDDKNLSMKEAFEVVTKKYGDNLTIKVCREYESMWAFVPIPKGEDTNERMFVGSFMECVNKRTGELKSIERGDMPNKRWRGLSRKEIEELLEEE